MKLKTCLYMPCPLTRNRRCLCALQEQQDRHHDASSKEVHPAVLLVARINELVSNYRQCVVSYIMASRI